MNQYEITINPTITKKGMLNLFWDSICGGSIGFGTINLECDANLYFAASERVKILKAANPSEYLTGDAVCFEDVMTEVLRAGHSLKYADNYEDDVTSFDLNHLMRNFKNVEPHILEQFMSGDYDAVTTDSLLQCLLLGEITYC